MGISQYTTVLTATIYRSHDEGCSADGYIGFINVGSEVGICVFCRIFHLATTGTVDEAVIYGTVPLAGLLEVTMGILHTAVFLCHLNGTYLTTIHDNGTKARSSSAGCRLTNTTCM